VEVAQLDDREAVEALRQTGDRDVGLDDPNPARFDGEAVEEDQGEGGEDADRQCGPSAPARASAPGPRRRSARPRGQPEGNQVRTLR